MFEHLTNIETAFGHVKRFSLVLSLGAILMALGAVWLSYRFQQQATERVYILLDGKVMEAFASGRQDNLEVEAREHVIRFHDRFFTLSPDGDLINQQLSEALYLGDGTVRDAYRVLREQGYYDRLVTGNISQEMAVDSVTLAMDSRPYRFRFYGRQQITRPTSKLTRRLVTTGVLREVARSRHNPHGLLIEKWETLENKDLKIEKR
ncbi:conjugative transposon protein TraK [Echinicola vietnamensis]|uniref:Conjugative transposon TraK protein n=1 Tax=Echinicola vietnamensis (strain DSM 17526 / LMG 23754 / KMM 6221) TaxID=926556 RepID=L0G4U0_ECHVK|nr:conjugative transposon protein TraK [Echinicola vietnamensis]AGA80542.1 conjugative transposon TraK protein [Echinicola vietnamensis DSM 17526]